MLIDTQTVQHLAQLARLHLSPDEQITLQHDLHHILEMMQKLSEVDTTGISPLVYIAETAPVMRPDTVLPHIDRDRALQNAPAATTEFFVVPKVI